MHSKLLIIQRWKRIHLQRMETNILGDGFPVIWYAAFWKNQLSKCNRVRSLSDK